MNCWVILAASMISCPWGRPVVYTEYYYEVPMVCLPSRPVVVYSRPISPPVAAEVQEVVTENALHEEAVAADADANASSDESAVTENASAEEEELVTENAAFNQVYGLSLSELALDWGVAVIGPGTLYPNQYGVASGGGFFGGSGSSNGGSGGGPWMPNCICSRDLPPTDQPIIPNTPGPNPNDANPVPEPMSLAIWSATLFAAFLYARRQRMLQPKPVPVVEYTKH